MSRWTDLPFDSLETARLFALQKHLEPTVIIEWNGFRSFYVGSGNKTILITQSLEGGTVRERKLRNASERKRVIQYLYYRGARSFRIGPWKATNYDSLEEVVAEKGLPGSEVLIYYLDENELHFKITPEGILVRELTLSVTS